MIFRTYRLNLLLFFFIFITNYHNLLNQIQTEIIVKFKENTSPTFLINIIQENSNIINFQKIFNLDEKQKSNTLLSSNQKILLNRITGYYKFIIDLKFKDSVYNYLSNLPQIENVSENFVYKIETDKFSINDPLYPKQWYLKTINAEKAWQFSSGKNVLIGFVDTGIDFHHPDLINQLWINSNEDINKNGRFDPWSDTIKIKGVYGDLNNKDDDGNGFIDDIIGYDFVNQFNANIGDYFDFDPIPADENGHGTLVAGVIAAEQNNNTGISGLAFGAKLVTLRAFDFSGNGQSDNIASAILYAALNNVKVINLSFGEDFYSPILHDAIKFAKSMGCVIVASSGNNGWDRRHFPSDYEEVISVGSSNINNRRDQLSNYGDRLDLLAPGSNIITTSINGNYKQVSGTSMAAPLVSSAAALLIENNPGLTPDEIEGLLKSNAFDVYTKGWDRESGSGILDISNALKFATSSEINILYPENECQFDKSKSTRIPIIGSITNPLFNYYQVFISDDTQPNQWLNITPKIYSQIYNDTIANLDLTDLNNSKYVLRIFLSLKNARTIEKRLNFSVFDSDSFSIKLLRANQIYFNDRRSILITAETNRMSEMTLEIRNLLLNDTFYITNHYKKDNFHQILLLREIQNGTEFSCKAIFRFGEGIVRERTIHFNKIDDDFSQGNFRKKYNTLPNSYLFNDVIDIYGDSKKNIVVNDISGGTWQSTKIYQFEQNRFIQKDTMSSVWIPVGFGDSNGDGLNEIFTKAFGSSILYQPKNKGENPFKNIIFADTTYGDLWAAGMFDFDGDGREELIAHTSSDIRIFKYSNSKYNLIDKINPVEQENKLGTSPGITFGNFDDDPQPELACALIDGRIFIYEFVAGKFQLEWADINFNSRSPQFLESADVDDDGVEEIISANFGTTFVFGREISEDPVWTIRLLKNSGKGNYRYIWSETFFGVKSGITQSGIAYRNGLFTGNIDLDKGKEVIFAPFPNLYIFKWDSITKKLKPQGWFSSSFTNSGIIHDFDNNGINEFGFSSGRGLEFFEYDTNFKILPPSGLIGWATNDSTAMIKWNKSNGAEGYDVFEIININNEFYIRDIERTNNNFILIRNLNINQKYRFVIQAFNTSLKTKSDYSPIIEINTYKLLYTTKAELIDTNRILLVFSGRLPDTPPNPGYFALENPKFQRIIPNSVNLAGDSCLILHFKNISNDSSFKLISHSFPDYYNNPSIDTSINVILIFKNQGIKELYLKNLILISRTELIIEFSEQIDVETARQIDNYVIKPFGKIDSIAIIDNNKVKVYLEKSPLIAPLGYYYTITVYGVKSVSGYYMTKGSGNTLGFLLEADNSNNAFVFPDPINLNTEEYVTFGNIPTDATIKIMTLNGEILQELLEVNKNGGVEWNLLTSNGKKVDTGIYLFMIEKSNHQPIIKKFSVIR